MGGVARDHESASVLLSGSTGFKRFISLQEYIYICVYVFQGIIEPLVCMHVCMYVCMYVCRYVRIDSGSVAVLAVSAAFH